MTFAVSDEFRDSFFEECCELLEAMQDGFSLMIDGRENVETIHTVFRAVHSIKGGAGAFDLNELVAFAHRFETVLDQLRSGKVRPTSELYLLFQQCGDHLSDLVSAARNGTDGNSETEALLLQRLQAATQIDLVPSTAAQTSDDDAGFVPLALEIAPLTAPAADTQHGWRITFNAASELFTSGNEPLPLIRALERFGPVKITADLSSVPSLDRLDPMVCCMHWTIDVETSETEDVILEVFEFVMDCAVVEIQPLTGADLSTIATPPKDAGSTGPDAGQQAPIALDDRDIAPSAPPIAATTAGGSASQTIRVDFEKVDKLINLVGELVIKEAALSQKIGQQQVAHDNAVLLELEGLKHLASEIQESVMAIRAQPVKPLFQRMARTIRDAAASTGKTVRLVMEGEGTEIDKTVLERLVDPLTHMVRNSVDHGLETQEDRIAAGKSPEGMIQLTAAHRSGRVVIEITDDGAGINRDRVRQVAEEKGLIAPDDHLTPPEIDALLFLPGFSSKQEVSELSGRGVGLDVVRSEIEALGGRMSVSSEAGFGSTFTISLPLTLAVQEGMVVDIAGQTMVVPIGAIKETLYATSATTHSIGLGEKMLSIRGCLMPVVDLGVKFGFRAEASDLRDRVLLVVETTANKQCALVVDALHDQRQVVIKSLETNYCKIEGIAAATILGDGRIALIVDPEGIARRATDFSPASALMAQTAHSEGGALETI